MKPLNPRSSRVKDVFDCVEAGRTPKVGSSLEGKDWKEAGWVRGAGEKDWKEGGGVG